MKTKLMDMFNDVNFGKGALTKDAGIMIYKSKDAVNFLMVQFKNRWDVYLHLYDERAPYRNIFVKGSSKKLEIAKNIAVRKLEREINNYVH